MADYNYTYGEMWNFSALVIHHLHGGEIQNSVGVGAAWSFLHVYPHTLCINLGAICLGKRVWIVSVIFMRMLRFVLQVDP